MFVHVNKQYANDSSFSQMCTQKIYSNLFSACFHFPIPIPVPCFSSCPVILWQFKSFCCCAVYGFGLHQVPNI